MGVDAAIAFDRRLRLLQRTVDVAALERRAAELRERQQAGEALGLVDTIDADNPFAGPIYQLMEVIEERGRMIEEAQRTAADFFHKLTPANGEALH